MKHEFGPNQPQTIPSLCQAAQPSISEQFVLSHAKTFLDRHSIVVDNFFFVPIPARPPVCVGRTASATSLVPVTLTGSFPSLSRDTTRGLHSSSFESLSVVRILIDELLGDDATFSRFTPPPVAATGEPQRELEIQDWTSHTPCSKARLLVGRPCTH